MNSAFDIFHEVSLEQGKKEEGTRKKKLSRQKKKHDVVKKKKNERAEKKNPDVMLSLFSSCVLPSFFVSFFFPFGETEQCLIFGTLTAPSLRTCHAKTRVGSYP
jgi:hypothetical protein